MSEEPEMIDVNDMQEVTDMDYDEDDNLMTIQVRKKKGS